MITQRQFVVGVRPKSGKRELDGRTVEYMIRLKTLGYSNRQIAHPLGVSTSTVSKYTYQLNCEEEEK